MSTPANDIGSQTERLLIVDTESMVCELLQFKLSNEGFAVDILHDGRIALSQAQRLSQYNMILVDLMDTEFTGVDFIKEIKRNPETFNIPVIILSATASEDDIVNGLNSGADDYLTKPFSSRELIARIKSVLRRRRMTMGRRMSNIMRFRDMEVDLGSGTVTIDNNPVQLSRTEFLILAMFIRHRGQFFDRAEIQHEAWDNETSVSNRAVDTNISRIRKKIGVYGRHIINRQGYGYGFVE